MSLPPTVLPTFLTQRISAHTHRKLKAQPLSYITTLDIHSSDVGVYVWQDAL